MCLKRKYKRTRLRTYTWNSFLTRVVISKWVQQASSQLKEKNHHIPLTTKLTTPQNQLMIPSTNNRWPSRIILFKLVVIIFLVSTQVHNISPRVALGVVCLRLIIWRVVVVLIFQMVEQMGSQEFTKKAASPWASSTTTKTQIIK